MKEVPTDPFGSGALPQKSAPMAAAVSSTALARALIAQLLPGADSQKLVRALIDERNLVAGAEHEMESYNSDGQIAARELNRIRVQLALGESARTLQHAFNNSLTALLAEAQLLKVEPLSEVHRAAVNRILELARRLVTPARRPGTRGA
jgi:signal transduction histidine kinase